MDDEPLVRAQQFVRDHQGANGVIASPPAGVADDVGIAFGKAREFRGIQTCIDAGEHRKAAPQRHRQGALLADISGVRGVGVEDFFPDLRVRSVWRPERSWRRSWCRTRVLVQKRERLLIRNEEQLWDLVWLSELMIEERNTPAAGDGIWIENGIMRLGGLIFGQDADVRPDPANLRQLRRDLMNPRWLASTGFPNGKSKRGVETLARRYLCSGTVFQRRYEEEWCDTDREIGLLQWAQSTLPRRIGTRWLAIEVNPSSNLLIWDIGDLREHPIWRLRPPFQDAGAFPLTACVGSDDPVTFACNLRGEYQLVLDAMMRNGLSAEQARQWSDDTREAGLSYRFTEQNEEDGVSPYSSILGCPPATYEEAEIVP